MSLPLVLCPALALLAVLVAGAGYEAWAEARDRRRCPAPGRLIRVGQHRLHLLALGERQPGQPVVVLEAGMTNWSFHWRRVQPLVARFARVLAYDRAGLGWSELGPRPRTTAQLVAELHLLLEHAEEPGPYLLVGHSMGGILVRALARRCPDRVAAMVLIDSAHEDQVTRLPGAQRELTASRALFTSLAGLRRVGLLRLLAPKLMGLFPTVTTHEDRPLFLNRLLGARYFETTRDELAVVARPQPAEARLQTLNARPLVVIQASGQPAQFANRRAHERWQRVRAVFDHIQRDLLALSTNSRLVEAQASVHAVQLEQP